MISAVEYILYAAAAKKENIIRKDSGIVISMENLITAAGILAAAVKKIL